LKALQTRWDYCPAETLDLARCDQKHVRCQTQQAIFYPNLEFPAYLEDVIPGKGALEPE
jgi:hypothetical protein